MEESAQVAATLFVTGMQRSGTTLLERLLASHPQISLLSQPFPFLFVEAKRELFRRRGWDIPPYPLAPLFLESRYGVEDLAAHLESWRLDAALLREVLTAMDGFSGQYTRFDPADLEAVLGRLVPGDLAAVLSYLYRALAGSAAAWVGGKETLCEELLPYLLDRGYYGIVILRDPRDVLASLNHGRGREHAGRLKPTLFNLRNWRKSVAFALRLQGHARFAWVRYEDLTTRPLELLNRIAPALDVDPFAEDLFAEGVRDREGQVWKGNSSHGAQAGISRASVGIYQATLPPEVARFVEAACYPELRYLGYPVSLGWNEVPDVLRSFVDPYARERDDLTEYADAAALACQELRRIELLARPASETARPYFLFSTVHDALRRAVFPG
jgi:hypothetical protein